MCVLFVEDEPVISMLAVDVLEEAGHEVLTAASGKQAMTYIEEMPYRFSCLVSDLNMPGRLTGIDVINLARRRYPDLPVVLATALGGTVPRSWLASQRVVLVNKPYTPSALVKLVHSLTHR